uniref:F-box domain-containing protein n=1 Tax=Tanacetum cinerariifolium TaxID=118510 RepID=A0A699KB18_TANCI|nr:hypothetical protein [Tanacetum cinerariifolium]
MEEVSSSSAVLSIDDLLVKILVRLPVISLHLYKFVSKRWLSLITSSYFIMRRSQIPNLDPPSVLFLLRPECIYDYDFVPLDNRIRDTRFATLRDGNYRILQSCNGLLLCCARTSSDDIYVYNPSINNNMFKLLPQCDKNLALYLGGGGQMRMAFDPTKSPHYKTILHNKLDVDHQVLTNIQTHVTLDDDKVDSDCQLFESRGFLLFVTTMFDTDHVPKLNIYGMRNEDSVWSVKYIVNLDEVRIFPKIWSVATSFWASFGVLSIILGEREDDSFLLMVCYLLLFDSTCLVT